MVKFLIIAFSFLFVANLVVLIKSIIYYYAYIKKEKTNQKFKEKILKIIKNILLLFLSFLTIDYVVSYFQKNKNQLEETKQKPKKNKGDEKRTKYIKISNLTNIIVSLAIVVAIMLIKHFSNCSVLIEVVKYVLYFRVLSRTLEINVSFVIDICKKDKKSNLTKYDRIKLAFFSLLEEVILFTAVYFVLLSSINVFEAILYGLSSFTLSANSFKCKLNLQYVAIYQAISAIILITLAFATYIGEKDKE